MSPMLVIFSHLTGRAFYSALVAALILKRNGNEVLGGFFDANLVPIKSLSMKNVDNSSCNKRNVVTEPTTSSIVSNGELSASPNSELITSSSIDFSMPSIELSTTAPERSIQTQKLPPLLAKPSKVSTVFETEAQCQMEFSIPTMVPSTSLGVTGIDVDLNRGTDTNLSPAVKTKQSSDETNVAQEQSDDVDVSLHIDSKTIGGGIYVYVCRMCQRESTKYHLIATHVRTHFDCRPYVCKICGKGFKVKRYLKEHIRGRHETKKYKCSFCQRSFNWRAALSSHSCQKKLNSLANKQTTPELVVKATIPKDAPTKNLSTDTARQQYPNHLKP